MDSMYVPRPTRLWKNKADFFRPFRSAADNARADGGSRASASVIGDRDVVQDDEDELHDLNSSLRTLVEVFPGIEPATFRDMLSKLGPESRLAVVTEQVLRRTRGVTISNKPGNESAAVEATGAGRRVARGSPLQVEETFRGERYHGAVRNLLYQEFKSLSHSSIRAVMAENNGSYSRARPVLQQVATRTWRFSISSLWSRKPTSPSQLVDHPALVWEAQDDPSSTNVPSLKDTGSPQLNDELRDLFVKPLQEQSDRKRAVADQAFARQLNTEDAESLRATYDCECCYATVSFEDIATCASGDHYLCHDCIRRSTFEALYGQGWARTADLDKASIRCFAPAIQECISFIPTHAVRQALSQDLENPHLWQDFQDRVSRESLVKSRVPLERCPSCPYAEVNEVPAIRSRNTAETIQLCRRLFQRRLHPTVADGFAPVAGSIIILLETIIIAVLLPLWLLVSGFHLLFSYFVQPQEIGTTLSSFPLSIVPTGVLDSSIKRVYAHRRGLRFRCRNESCGRVSCTRCRGIWHDPHICFEDEKTSLRTTIEASATAAVKRTCPRCMLSFIKSSGCNKLVCNCGYTMCYVCRAEITSKEGYAHFCQHFRPNGGRCRECDRCDLYGDEDEEAAIRHAATLAERQWREKEALKNRRQQTALAASDAETAEVMIEAVLGQGRRGKWYEELLDFCVDSRVVFLDD